MMSGFLFAPLLCLFFLWWIRGKASLCSAGLCCTSFSPLSFIHRPIREKYRAVFYDTTEKVISMTTPNLSHSCNPNCNSTNQHPIRPKPSCVWQNGQWVLNDEAYNHLLNVRDTLLAFSSYARINNDKCSDALLNTLGMLSDMMTNTLEAQES